MLNRALLDSYSTISRHQAWLQRETVAFGVDVLRLRPELLVDLLVSTGAWEVREVHDLATCVPGRCASTCVSVLAPVEFDPDGGGGR